MRTSERAALVIQRFVPSRTNSSPSIRAVVLSDDGSEPASGSVSPNEAMTSPDAMRGSHCCFCSSVPAMTRIWPASPLLVPSMERNAGAA